jgi:hypothetical protein
LPVFRPSDNRTLVVRPGVRPAARKPSTAPKR